MADFFKKLQHLKQQQKCLSNKLKYTDFPNKRAQLFFGGDIIPTRTPFFDRLTQKVLKNNSVEKSYKFSEAGGVLKHSPDEGSERGAYRHVLWSSSLASKYGPELAKKVTDCHESDAYFDKNRYIFETLGEADQNVDYRNNELGISFGKENPNQNFDKDFALKVLQNLGNYVWQAEKFGNQYQVKQKPLEKEAMEALKILWGLE